MTDNAVSAETLARQATGRVLELVLRDGSPGSVVDSPPGAGKTTLVEEVSTTAVFYAGLRVAVITARNEQAYDLVRRLMPYGSVPIQMLQSSRNTPPLDIGQNPRIRVVARVADLLGVPSITVGNAAKFKTSIPDFQAPAFDLLICDEAYQLAYGDFAPLFQLARQVLLVGDPGQLPPVVEVDTTLFERAPSRPHWPVPREFLRRHPDVPIVRLPVSRRLPPDTVQLIQPSLYPQLPFRSAARPEDRRLTFATTGFGTSIDRLLAVLEGGASIAGLLLPPTDISTSDVDEELSAVMADVVTRLLERGGQWQGQRALTASDIGCVDGHVASVAATRRGLQRRRVPTSAVMVNTPEIWQGLQRPVMVVKHPLSGRRRLSPFDLDPGRLCVMLSRHQVACVVVARDGIGEALSAHRQDCANRPMGADDVEWMGRQAHTTLWSELERSGRLIRL